MSGKTVAFAVAPEGVEQVELTDPWQAVERADVVRGRTVTSWPSLQTDLRNAGAEWVDRSVVVDGNLVTSRKPGDLKDFDQSLLDKLGM